MADYTDFRKRLIEWEAAYELVTLLKELEAAVPKKPLVELPSRSGKTSPTAPRQDENWDSATHSSYNSPEVSQAPLPPPPPPAQALAHKYPWIGVKSQILIVIAGLLRPEPGTVSPGNPDVQSQVVRHNGIISLLNCCVYDDHNPFARERVQICLKWLMDGSDAAQVFLRDLVAVQSPPGTIPPGAAADASEPPPPQLPGLGNVVVPAAPIWNPVPGQPLTRTVRIDGIEGEIKVELRHSDEKPPGASPFRLAGPPLFGDESDQDNDSDNGALLTPARRPPSGQHTTRQIPSHQDLADIISLGDSAGRLVINEGFDEDDFM
jgi:hypothetical protein